MYQELAEERHQAGIDRVDWFGQRAAAVVSDQEPGSTAGASAMSAARSVMSCAMPARSIGQRSCVAWTRALRPEIFSAIVLAERVSWISETREQITAFQQQTGAAEVFSIARSQLPPETGMYLVMIIPGTLFSVREAIV